jgi:F-type H+-transporting ATPase subunit b
MHTVTVASTGEDGLQVHLLQPAAVGSTTTTIASPGTTAVAGVAENPGPSPIAPEAKELIWGAGAFIVLFVLMRLVLFPRLKRGMDARYGKIRGDHDSANAMRDDARAEVASYEADLAAVKAEAGRRVEAARQTLEAERAPAIAELNAELFARRAEATAAIDASRAAAATQIRDAVADVSARAAELATGRRPDPVAVQQVVDTLIAGGVR